MRFVGIRAGGLVNESIPGSSQGHGLFVAGMGSRLARSVLSKIPMHKMQEAMLKFAKDPEFAANVLETRMTQRNRGRLEREMNLFAIQAALIEDSTDREDLPYDVPSLWD